MHATLYIEMLFHRYFALYVITQTNSRYLFLRLLCLHVGLTGQRYRCIINHARRFDPFTNQI